MELDEIKIKEVLLGHGLSTKRSERISKDLASRDLFKSEKKEVEQIKKRSSLKTETKDVSEVIKQ